jgi:hypothetical protein
MYHNIIINVDFDGCSSEVDNIWYIQWPNTLRGTTSIESCPGGQAVLGMYYIYISQLTNL